VTDHRSPGRSRIIDNPNDNTLINPILHRLAQLLSTDNRSPNTKSQVFSPGNKKENDIEFPTHNNCRLVIN
jgi:hypothetical protein